MVGEWFVMEKTEDGTAKVYNYRVFFEYNGKTYGDAYPLVISGYKDLEEELKESPRCFIDIVEFCVCSWLEGNELLVEGKSPQNIYVRSEDGSFNQDVSVLSYR